MLGNLRERHGEWRDRREYDSAAYENAAAAEQTRQAEESVVAQGAEVEVDTTLDWRRWKWEPAWTQGSLISEAGAEAMAGVG